MWQGRQPVLRVLFVFVVLARHRRRVLHFKITQHLGFEKILASVYGGNDASLRLLAKVGYRECGRLRRSAFFGGQWHDELLAEILRESWRDS